MSEDTAYFIASAFMFAGGHRTWGWVFVGLIMLHITVKALIKAIQE